MDWQKRLNINESILLAKTSMLQLIYLIMQQKQIWKMQEESIHLK